MSLLLSWLADLASETLARLSATWLRQRAASLRRGLSIAAVLGGAPIIGDHLHLYQIRKTVRRMPYIHRQIRLDPLTDYVPSPKPALDPLDLTPTGSDMPSHRIRTSLRTVFLGGPGAGKTTYLRHQLLRLAVGTNEPGDVNRSQHFVPFYVILNDVDPSEPSPILTYLLRTNAILSFNGHRRLLRLAKARRVLLVLDGYDEILLAGGESNDQQASSTRPPAHIRPSTAGGSGDRDPIRDDIRKLFAVPSHFHAFEPPHHDVYEYLRRCPVWLSSRRNFFLRNRPYSDSDLKIQPVLAIELSNIRNAERLRLVQRIFRSYKTGGNDPDYILNAERFVQLLDLTLSGEMVAFSYNPLFLTVMTVVYAESATINGTADVPLTTDLNALLIEFVTLLLAGLDRARFLDRERLARRRPSVSSAEAFMQRRSAWESHKLACLSYIAAKTLFSKRSALDFDSLNETARTFFLTTYVSGTPTSSGQDVELARILKGFDRPHSRYNLIRQLIACDLLVPAGVELSSDTFTFAHHHFHEVLAARYYDDPARLPELTDRSTTDDAIDFIALVFKNSPIRDRILESLLRAAEANPSNPNPGSTVLACLQQKPASYDASPALRAFLELAVVDHRRFRLPSAVVEYLNPDEEFRRWLIASASRALDHNISYPAEICFEVLAHSDSNALLVLLQERLKSPRWSIASEVAVKYAAIHQRDLLFRIIQDKSLPSGSDTALALTIANAVTRISDSSVFLTHLFRTMSLSQISLTVASLYALKTPDEIRPRMFDELIRHPALSDISELCTLVVQLISERSHRVTDIKGEHFWIVTKAASATFSQADSSALLWRVFWNASDMRDLDAGAKSSVLANCGHERKLWEFIESCVDQIPAGYELDPGPFS